MAVISFILAVVTDAVWAKWSHAITNSRACAAANWSALMYLFGIIYTLVVLEKDILQILVYVFGAWVGTFLTVWHIKSRKKAT